MADISMCSAFLSKMNRCPLKDTCYRHKATPNEFRQAWFVYPPYDQEKQACEMYWAEEASNG